MTTKGQPFFFDTNVFDPEDPRYMEVDRKKPKYEYTKEQLAMAKDAAFEAGKLAGFKESQASLMQEIQKTVQKIDRDTASLFAGEQARNQLFEAEAVHLSLKIFEKVFAAYAKKAGTTELENIIADALLKHRDINMIAIEVHPDLQNGIQDFIRELTSETHKSLVVKGNPAISRMECKIIWLNGGITYDVQMIKDRIYKTLSESLAVHNINVQDDENGPSGGVETGETKDE